MALVIRPYREADYRRVLDDREVFGKVVITP